MCQEEAYNYLGYNEGDEMQYAQMKENVEKRMLHSSSSGHKYQVE